MDIGFSSMNTHRQLPPGEQARLLEERGYESIWFGEHSQIPLSRESDHPRDAELAEPYKNMLDPYVSLAVASAATERLKLGTSVSLMLERELFSQAKTIMTLDRLSEGRLLVGIGVGWNREQFENASALPWKRRFTALKETVAALRALWAEDEPEYHGEFVDFAPVWCNPKPVQPGGPPIVMGAMGPVGLRHTAEWADGWMPLDVHLEDPAAAIADMRKRLTEAGRDPDAFDLSMIVMRRATLDRLSEFRDLGVRRCLVGTAMDDWDDRDAMRREIDRIAEIIPKVA